MDDAGKPMTWKAWLMLAMGGMASSAGGYVSSHWGGVTTEQLSGVKNDVAAVAAKQQSSDAITAKQHVETKAEIAAVADKVDKLSTAVLAPKKRKVARDQ
jgi:hypothetical protein